MLDNFNADNLEKRKLYIHELINFLQNKQNDNSFKILLKNILELYENCYNAYQCYISNFFSYTKPLTPSYISWHQELL